MASSSLMQGLHAVDQNEMTVGTPALRISDVEMTSPLAFSTFTEGTCAYAANESAVSISAMMNFFIIMY